MASLGKRLDPQPMNIEQDNNYIDWNREKGRLLRDRG